MDKPVSLGLMERSTFERVNLAAQARIYDLLRRWLPYGHREGAEWIALSPRRKPRRRNTIRITLSTGHWVDPATGDKGEDVTSLAAHLLNLPQAQAARCVARMIGINPDDMA